MSNHENEDLLSLEVLEQDHHRIMGEHLNELRRNPHFQAVIIDGYLRDKQLASFSLLAVPQERDRRTNIFEDLIAGSNLMYFFSMIDAFYKGAVDPILSDEEQEAIDQLDADESAEGVTH